MVIRKFFVLNFSLNVRPGEPCADSVTRTPQTSAVAVPYSEPFVPATSDVTIVATSGSAFDTSSENVFFPGATAP